MMIIAGIKLRTRKGTVMSAAVTTARSLGFGGSFYRPKAVWEHKPLRCTALGRPKCAFLFIIFILSMSLLSASKFFRHFPNFFNILMTNLISHFFTYHTTIFCRSASISENHNQPPFATKLMNVYKGVFQVVFPLFCKLINRSGNRLLGKHG